MLYWASFLSWLEALISLPAPFDRAFFECLAEFPGCPAVLADVSHNSLSGALVAGRPGWQSKLRVECLAEFPACPAVLADVSHNSLSGALLAGYSVVHSSTLWYTVELCSTQQYSVVHSSTF